MPDRLPFFRDQFPTQAIYPSQPTTLPKYLHISLYSHSTTLVHPQHLDPIPPMYLPYVQHHLDLRVCPPCPSQWQLTSPSPFSSVLPVPQRSRSAHPDLVSA